MKERGFITSKRDDCIRIPRVFLSYKRKLISIDRTGLTEAERESERQEAIIHLQHGWRVTGDQTTKPLNDQKSF